MKTILTDVHTHTKFSPDGRSDIGDMLKAALKKGAASYGISEHFDYDYKVDRIAFYGGAEASYTDAEAYFSRAREWKRQYEGKMEVLVGGEFGYTDNPAAAPLYRALIEAYSPDFIVNSVHTNGVLDYSDPEVFLDGNGKLKDKREIYSQYLARVKHSVEAPYDYDIIGHFTYCMRCAPYEDKRLRYADYPTEIDAILKRIIERGKILEVNSSSYGAPCDFLPDEDILGRYYELGGRRVSFASDAHDVSRVLDKREKVVAALKKIGFSCVTVPRRGEYISVEL